MVPKELISMAIKLVILTHAERCACGLVLPAGVEAGWDEAVDSIVCAPCLQLADELEDVPPLQILLTQAS